MKTLQASLFEFLPDESFQDNSQLSLDSSTQSESQSGKSFRQRHSDKHRCEDNNDMGKVIDIESLYLAMQSVYSYSDRCVVEFEEIVRNLFALNKTVVDILPGNTLFKYDHQNKQIKLRYHARNYLKKYIPIQGKSTSQLTILEISLTTSAKLLSEETTSGCSNYSSCWICTSVRLSASPKSSLHCCSMKTCCLTFRSTNL